MDKNGISYEIIDYSGITNVKFYTSTDNGSYIPFHWHRAVEIIYIQEGELDVIVESSSHTLHPGDCILINANIIHSTKCTVPNKAIVLQIPLDFMEKYIPNVQQLVFFWDYQTKDPVKKTKIEMLKTTLEQLQIIDDIRPDGFILRFNSLIFELLFQLYHNFRVKVFQSDLSQQKKDLDRLNLVLNALLEIFFICLLRNHEKNMIVPNPAGKKQEKNIIFILKYIELHYATLTLPELSAFFNYSERQLIRILKNYTGKTFSTLIQDIRLSRAAELLKQPTLPVTTVMEEIGYSNITHFYKIFEKRFHMTPAEYRSSISPDSSLL